MAGGSSTARTCACRATARACARSTGARTANGSRARARPRVVLWPCQSKDGPMGKTPQLLAPTQEHVEVVACHPKQAVVAAGYADGLILLVRIDDGAEVLARKPGDAPVTALAWSSDGKLLAFGTEDGSAGVIDLG